ncbi:MAG: hypothetical protein IPH94_19265 [Saprospiraceae bacterium]|nr:hypothetical protein [Saprospiraceae bacterium]
MALMGKIRIWIVLIFMSCSSTISQSLIFNKQDGQDWRNACIAALDVAYLNYRNNKIAICPQDSSDLQYDYNRKYRALRDF